MNNQIRDYLFLQKHCLLEWFGSGTQSVTIELSSVFIKMISYIIWIFGYCKLKAAPRPHECRTKHPGTKHPMPFFATPDKTSRINLPPRTKHPMQFLSPRTKHPMPFLPPRTKHPMLLLPPRTKHPTLCLKPMKVHKTSHLVNCHYYYWYS